MSSTIVTQVMNKNEKRIFITLNIHLKVNQPAATENTNYK